MGFVQVFQPRSLSPFTSLGLLLVRVVPGAAFMIHGSSKIQDPFHWMGPDANVPGLLQALAALSEFGGGFAWILGLLTPLASFGIACTMAVAVWSHARVWGDPFVASQPKLGSYELPSAYLCIALLLILAGPGRFSADRLFFGQKP